MPWRTWWRSFGGSATSHSATFLTETGLELEDIYRRNLGWLELQRRAGFVDDEPVPEDARLGGALRRMLHIDDRRRLAFLRTTMASPGPPQFETLSKPDKRLLAMLHFALWSGRALSGPPDIPSCGIRRRQELLELIDVLEERAPRVTYPSSVEDPPLMTHGTYSRDEAPGIRRDCSGAVMADIRFVPNEHADLLFVTLNKTEEHFSPTTMYADLAITPRLSQWESQGKTSVASSTGQRYVHHRELGSSVHLFIRESKRNSLKDEPRTSTQAQPTTFPMSGTDPSGSCGG